MQLVSLATHNSELATGFSLATHNSELGTGFPLQLVTQNLQLNLQKGEISWKTE
jgi:hypothetical protein